MNHFARDEQGSMTVIVAVMASVLLGFGALAIDLSSSYGVHAKLQGAADAAALAAVQQMPDTSAATAAALDIAGKNAPSNYGTILTASDLVYGTYDPVTKTFTQVGNAPNAVRLTTSRTAAKGNAPPTFLARVLDRGSGDVRTSATAYRLKPSFCVYVLDPSAVSAFDASGAGTFQAPNCNVQVNSWHNKAASAGNGTTVKAKSYCIVGGYNGNFSPVPNTGCPALADPLAAVAEPAQPASASSSGQPGLHTGTVNFAAGSTLAPGLYYFKGANVTVASGANISGSGVTWFFDSASTLDFNGNGTVQISAPTSGAYRGIAIFQSRSATINNVAMKITGGANFLLDGTIYTPRANLQLSGSSDVTVNSRSGYLITNRLNYTGSSTFTIGAWNGTQALAKPTPATLVQ